MGFETDTAFMRRALELAQKAVRLGEVPIGAVVVKDGQIVSEGYNLRESHFNPIAHAEIIAIHRAARKLGQWRLLDCTLYVSLEPCVMCAGAIVNSRIPRVVYGAKDPKGGAVESLYKILGDIRLNHRPEVQGGVCAAEASELLTSFFKRLR